MVFSAGNRASAVAQEQREKVEGLLCLPRILRVAGLGIGDVQFAELMGWLRVSVGAFFLPFFCDTI
jgi:hypothetical protein